MRVKKKIISIIIATILLVMISFSYVQAIVELYGLAGVPTLLGMGSTAITNGGTYISLSLNDIANANNKNIYCICHGQRNKSTTARYKVLTYIEIADGIATMWDVNGKNGHSLGYNIANSYLAEILSGNYGDTGYGPAKGEYTATQLGLYAYWPDWISAVGLVDTSWTSGNYDTDIGADVVNQAKMAVDAGANPSAVLYLLDCDEGGDRTANEDENEDENEVPADVWQRLMIAQASSMIEDEEPPPDNPDYDGYIKIRGKVWLDGDAGKGNKINGIYGDSTDQGLGGIKVTLCDSGGGQFDDGSVTETNPDGSYEIKVNLDQSPHVYKLYDEPGTVHERLMNGAYVKFEYNGYEYTTVAPYQTNLEGKQTSRAIEDSGARSSFDSSNSTVGPNTGTPSGNNMNATTQKVINFNTYAYKKTENENPTIVWCYGDGLARTYQEGYNPAGRTYQLTNPNGEWLDVLYEYNKDAHVSHIEEEYVSYNPPQYDAETGNEIKNRIYYWTDWCDDGHSAQTTPITNLIIYNVNLGLFKREQPDIALESDISDVDVIMNNQKYNYIYGEKGKPELNNDVLVKFQNENYTYRRPVYPENVANVVDNNNDALKVRVRYIITLKNQSTTLPVKVHKLWNYYEPEYTIMQEQSKVKVNNTREEANYKKSEIELNEAITIAPCTTKEIYIKYDISIDAIKGLLIKDATLNNVFEIHTYSTQYGSSTLYAEQRSGGRTGNPYAGRDIDSSPTISKPAPACDIVEYNSDSERLGVKEYIEIDGKKIYGWEDDTDIAPSFVLELAKKHRVISGTVYEDLQTEDSKIAKERLGDGKLDAKEPKVKNVRVELWECIDENNDGVTDKEKIATMYGAKQNKEVIAKPAVTWTDKNGDFYFGKEDEFGVVVSNYKIKYVYGDDEEDTIEFEERSQKDKLEVNGQNIQFKYLDDNIKGKGKVTTINGHAINARNYKSTIVTQNPIKEIMKKGEKVENSEKWHLLEGVDSTTTAVDTDSSRSKIDNTDLINSNFGQAFNVEAESKEFKLQVEFTINPLEKVDITGDLPGDATFDTECTVFDFGIIERPREDLVIDKNVSRLKLTLANGQIIIDGDPRVKNLDYTKAMGVKIPQDATAKDCNEAMRRITIEMDAEYIQGATLEIWYEITATNYSEKDYEGSEYYYYGENRSKLIDTYVNYVLDYLDPELIVDTGNGINEGWEVITAEKLYDNGYLSKATYDKLVKENYLIFVTNAFATDLPAGRSRSKTLYASKLLGNKDDALQYENYTEIVEIDGKVARTINSVADKTREQVDKTYIPGDSILTIDYRQQDEDGIDIIITPPTGSKNNIIIYIITTVIALAVIGTGVYIIKKRVLK